SRSSSIHRRILSRARDISSLSVMHPGQGELRRKHSREPCDAEDTPCTFRGTTFVQSMPVPRVGTAWRSPTWCARRRCLRPCCTHSRLRPISRWLSAFAPRCGLGTMRAASSKRRPRLGSWSCTSPPSPPPPSPPPPPPPPPPPFPHY